MPHPASPAGPEPLTRPEPPLSDGVVALRPLAPGDVDEVTEACQDGEIARFLPLPYPYRREDAVAYVATTTRQWDDGSKATFAIVPAGDPAPGTEPPLLGVLTLAVGGSVGNAGYWVAPGCRRLGVARRALSLVTSWAFDTLGLGVVILEIREENVASRGVAIAAGYHESGRLDVNTATGKTGGLIYSRLATDL